MASNLAPGFLVAAPSLLDPNFQRTVVLLVDHRDEGSLGFVLNRPADDRLRAMLGPLGLEAAPEEVNDSLVLVGGPVAPNTGWLVFEQGGPAVSASDIVRISDKVAVSASRDLLEALVRHKGPERMALMLGYSGWGPGQLDAEIQQGSWIPIDFSDKIIFDTPIEERWAAALRLLGIDPGSLTLTPTRAERRATN
jgi:putative transcriptional regulator